VNRAEFTVNVDYPWSSVVMPLIRRTKKPSKKRAAAKLYTPKTAWARVIEDPLGDD
jgi:hypothetical protein